MDALREVWLVDQSWSKDKDTNYKVEILSNMQNFRSWILFGPGPWAWMGGSETVRPASSLSLEAVLHKRGKDLMGAPWWFQVVGRMWQEGWRFLCFDWGRRMLKRQNFGL